MKHAYIFDFDGTLVDSMPCWSEKMLSILRTQGISYPPDIIKRIAPLGDWGTAKYFREELGVLLSFEQMQTQMDAFALPKYRDEILLKPGVKEFLEAAKAQGIALYVLTASPHKMADPCLKRNGVWELFDRVWTSEDFGLTKSQVQIYTEALKLTGTQATDTVFFDDNLTAVETAAKAGLYTVGVYDPTGEDFACQMKAAADRYIYGFAELHAELPL